VLVVWCQDWPLAAAGVPPSVPAAAFHANRVVACTAAARAEGVRRGLRRREAQARCPELVVERHDQAREVRAFEAVVAVVAGFTPAVEIVRPGLCAFGTRGPSRYFGGDEALAERVRSTVAEVLPGGHGCRVGVADGVFAAALAARRDLVVAPGEGAAFLAPLPLRLLDEPDLVDLLGRLGVTTMGGFAALPAGDVVARFGAVGLAAHRRAQGTDDRPLDARVPRPDLSVQVALDPPAEGVDTAAFAAKSLADDVCSSLAGAGLVCTCVRIEASTEHGEELSRVWRHHRAFTPAAVAQRVRWQLEGWLAAHQRCGCVPPESCPGGGVVGACPNPSGGTSGGLTLLRLVPEDVVADRGAQGGFWGGATEADERAAQGLARVQGLLGPEGVVTAVLRGGRGPAEQVQLVPWGEPRVPDRPPAGTASPLPASARQRSSSRSGSGSGSGSGRQGQGQGQGSGGRGSGRREGAKPGTRVRTAGRSPSPTERPAWPGRLPSPSPATVLGRLLPAEVVDATGAVVGVNNRSELTSPPARVSIDGGPWERVDAWAGPWTADERWWDPREHRRRARFQTVVGNGNAYLLCLEGRRWWLEGRYD
jgi:protein ImuB